MKKKNRKGFQTASGDPISRIHLGTWPLSGWYFGPVEERESIELLEGALDVGINAFDTAPIYGPRSAEDILGRVFEQKREKVWITSKCGLIYEGEGPFFFELHGVDHKKTKVYRNLSKKSILKECDLSLQRLRSDYIDLYLLHWPDPRTPLDESLAALQDLKESGKIRHAGLSNHNVEAIHWWRTKSSLSLDAVQDRYNLMQRKSEQAVLPYVRKHKIPFFAYSPLAQGALTDFYPNLFQDRDSGDLRNFSYLSGDLREKYLHSMHELTAISLQSGISVAAIAIAYVLQCPGIDYAIAGSRKLNHLKPLGAAMETRLSGEMIEKLNDLFLAVQYNGH